MAVLFLIGQTGKLIPYLNAVCKGCEIDQDFNCIRVSNCELDIEALVLAALYQIDVPMYVGIICEIGNLDNLMVSRKVINFVTKHFPNVPLIITALLIQVDLLTGLESVLASLQLELFLKHGTMVIVRSLMSSMEFEQKLMSGWSGTTDGYLGLIACDAIATYSNMHGAYQSMWPLQHCTSRTKVFDICSSLPAHWARKLKSTNSTGVARTKLVSSTGSADTGVLPVICSAAAVIEFPLLTLKKSGPRNSIQYKQLSNSVMASTFVWATPLVVYPGLYMQEASALQAVAGGISSSSGGGIKKISTDSDHLVNTMTSIEAGFVHQYYRSLCMSASDQLQRPLLPSKNSKTVSNTAIDSSTATDSFIIVCSCTESIVGKKWIRDISERALAVIASGAFSARYKQFNISGLEVQSASEYNLNYC